MNRTKFARAVLFAVAALLCVSLTACGSKPNNGGHPAAGTSSAPAASGAGCQHVDSVKFDKTKFVLHAGLAFGAFHRWIYKPYKANGFTSGAKGRVKALIKAAAAGAFTVHELKIAKQDAESSPTLCKIVAPLDKAEAKLSTMSGSLKSGSASSGDIEDVNNSVNGAQQGADKGGVHTPDSVPSDSQLLSTH